MARFTQKQLDDLRKARAEGALSVMDANGRRVQYRSDDEMAALEREMMRDLGLLTSDEMNVRLMATRKALD